MTYRHTISYLYSLQKSGIKLGLDNIRVLLAGLGDPHTGYPAIHVAGTSGKGSVAAMLEAVLRQAGYRTGLYTSPHFIDFRERIRVNGRMISAAAVVRIVSILRPAVRRLQATYFETVTALAFKYFAEQRVEVAVIEVGLGGRFDATNVIMPQVAVITPVDYDHQEYLGDTLALIGREKAGIIKPGVPVVIAPQRPTVMRVIRQVSRTQTAPLIHAGSLQVGPVRPAPRFGSRVRVRDLKQRDYTIHLPLTGKHQVANLQVAIAALNCLPENRWRILPRHYIRGFKKLVLPGRVQVVRSRPYVILDMAHNPSKMKALVSCLKNDFTFKRLFLVIGIMKDKDTRGIMRLAAGLKPYCIVTRPHMERAEKVENLVRLARRYRLNAKPLPRVGEAVRYALRLASPADAVCITGSVYTVGEAMRYI